MEGAERMESKNELLKSQAAIRCAKTAILLSSLKSFPNRHVTAASNDQEEVKEMMMMKEIGDLKMKLARERFKNKRIKLCGLVEMILQVIVLLSISTFFLVIALMYS